jgi:saccharopine dehydrogenase-like NADP-dependent oxidoreductase
MKNILVIGAGLSASSMIRYFTQNAKKENWNIKVGDRDGDLAKSKIGDCAQAEGFTLNALDPAERQPLIQWADLVISMLPAQFHMKLLKIVLSLKPI